eukprot:gene8611-8792_t
MTVLGAQNRRMVVLTATLPHLGVQALARLSATSRANRKAEMVAAGLVKIKLQQLLDAAGRRGDVGVPGVEVWVQAYHKLGMSCGLPGLPVAICCSQLGAVREQLPHLAAKDWDDMLILAVNLLDAAVAEIMLDYVIPNGTSCSLEGGKVQTGGHHAKNAVPPHDQHSPALQQRLTPRLVRVLLDTAVVRRHTGVVRRLCRVASARSLSHMELSRLLRSAVTAQHHAAIKPLLALHDQEQALASHRTALAGVLRVAIEQHNNKALRLLCEDAAIQEFAALTVGGLVQSALRSSNGDAVPVLCGLPGAQGIHRAYLSLLLEAAVKGGHHQAVQVLSDLPGNMTELEMLVPAGGMYSVMYTAIHQNRKQMVYHLCLSPAVQELDPGSIAQLIEEAVVLRRGVMVRHLFWIEPAQLISTGQLARLLEVAIRAQDGVAVSCMCELECMQHVEAELLWRPLQLAVQLGDAGSVCSLCQLRSAQQVAACDLEELLRVCVQEQHHQETCSGVVCALCQLPAALSISAVSLCSLLKAAGNRGDMVLQQELESLSVQAGHGHGLVAAAVSIA